MKSPCHILLVQDDQDDVELLKDTLDREPFSYQIDILMRGDLALPWLKSSKFLPTFIVIDLNLPKIHGRELLRSIKTNDSYKDIPVLILTTSSSKDDLEYCIKHGAEKFITKPTTMEGFHRIGHTILQLAAARC